MSNDGNFWANNPYQANAPVEQVVPVSVDKPTSMVVFGILNIVWGALGLCGLTMGIALQMMDIQNDGSNPMQELIDNPTYHVITLVFQGLGIISTIMLLVSGIGLLNGHAYGRLLAIIYSIMALVSAAGMFLVNLAYIAMPAIAQGGDAGGDPQKVALMAGGIGVMVGGVCPFIYPTLLLIFVNRAPIVNYLKAQGRL